MRQFLKLLDPDERRILIGSTSLMLPMYVYCWVVWPSSTFFWSLLLLAVVGLVGALGVMWTGAQRMAGHHLDDIDPNAGADDDEV